MVSFDEQLGSARGRRLAGSRTLGLWLRTGFMPGWRGCGSRGREAPAPRLRRLGPFSTLDRLQFEGRRKLAGLCFFLPQVILEMSRHRTNVSHSRVQSSTVTVVRLVIQLDR